jgi:Domain of unknown function (DUF4282)
MDQPPREKTLAGQPQEPWQSYSPPPADNQDTYTYPQSAGQGAHAYPQSGQGAHASQGSGQAYAGPAQGYQGQSYPPDQSFPGQDPSLTRQDMPFPGQAFQDQAFQDPGYPGPQSQAFQEQPYPGQPDQAAQHWQEGPVEPVAARARRAGKGFFGSLFDFGFNSFVTPKIVKALYVLYTIWMVVWAIVFLRLGFKYGGASGGIFTLVIVDPIFLLLTLGVYRVILEFFVVVHRMHDDLRAIRERDGDRG